VGGLLRPGGRSPDPSCDGRPSGWERTGQRRRLDTIARIAEASRRLDLEGFAGDASYALEVSSPGLERVLRSPLHFGWSVGQRVKVKTVEPVDGRRVHEGALVSAGAEAIVIASEGGELRVPYDGIASARTVFAWKRAGSRT
jgi:ribosome maturation factor RimP